MQQQVPDEDGLELRPLPPDGMLPGETPCVAAADGLSLSAAEGLANKPNDWQTGRSELGPAERALLLKAARDGVFSFVLGTVLSSSTNLPDSLTRKQACFVTLTRGGALRGCIGNVAASMPLFEAVQKNALAAASRDPRFPPVTADELQQLRIEISLLTEPELLLFNSPDDLLRRLEPGVSGVLLQMDGNLGTFLPQVWHLIPEPAQFMNRLSQKAGFPPDAWRRPGALISVYQVECFED